MPSFSVTRPSHSELGKGSDGSQGVTSNVTKGQPEAGTNAEFLQDVEHVQRIDRHTSTKTAEFSAQTAQLAAQ